MFYIYVYVCEVLVAQLYLTLCKPIQFMQNNLKEYKGIEKLIFSKEHGIKAIKYQILPLRFKSVMFRTNQWHVCVIGHFVIFIRIYPYFSCSQAAALGVGSLHWAATSMFPFWGAD